MEKSKLDEKVDTVYISQLIGHPISLKNFYDKSLADQQNIIKEFHLQEFLDQFGGLQSFKEKIALVDPKKLELVKLDRITKIDTLSIEYTFLTDEQIGALTLNQLSSKITRDQALVLQTGLAKIPKTKQKDLKDVIPSEDLLNLTLSELNSSILSNEIIDFLIKNRGEKIVHLLSDSQMENFIKNLDIKILNEELYEEIFHYLVDDINKKRFSFLSNVQVDFIMERFKGAPRNLLSDSQFKHYFGNLKDAQVDHDLYKNLFYYDSDRINKKRFHSQ